MILIGVWHLYLDLDMINGLQKTQVLNIGSLDLEGAKNINVLKVLIWGFGGHWGFLTEFWHPDIDLDMVTGLWYTHILNFCYLS